MSDKPLSEQMQNAYEAFTLARIDAWTEKVASLEAENTEFREAFASASKRVSVGNLKRLLFKCSHCEKDTPLLIDGLLNKAHTGTVT